MIYILCAVFLIVLFLYIHIFFHLKTSDDLDIYDIETPSKDKLEEICDLRQPVIFAFYNEEILEKCKMTYRGNKEEICGVSISCLLLNQIDSQ